MRAHANVLDGKRPPIIEKRLLLVPYRRNQRREGFLQVSFIEGCLAGAQWSRDNKQRWLLLAQGVVSSCVEFVWTLPGRTLKLCIQSGNGLTLSVSCDFYCRFQIAIVFVVSPICLFCGDGDRFRW